MDRLIAPNSVDAAHADVAPGAGTPQYATSGNPGAGIPATSFPAYAFNAMQEELIALIVGAGIAPDRTVLTQVREAVQVLATTASNPSGALVGASGQNNVGTPNSIFDLASMFVTVVDPVTNLSHSVRGPAGLSCNITTAGPVAGGRDQVAAFAASSIVALFYIYKPSTDTLSLIWSAGSPTVGPVLPAGYTMWKYVGSFPLDGATHLYRQRLRGDRISFDGMQQIFAAVGNHGWTARDLSAFVPDEALMTTCRGFISGAAVPGALDEILAFSVDGGTNTSNQVEAVINDSAGSDAATFELPNVLVAGVPTVYTTGTGGQNGRDFHVLGYTVPN